MENFLHGVMDYLRANPHFGEVFAFLVAFLESLPIVGTIIPGTVTMTVVGILIGTNALPFTNTLLITSLAAFMGDCIGFIVGYWYNERLRTIWPFKKYPKWLTMGENFFHKHGGKSIIIGRFFGPARSMVPLIAGLLRLTWLRFCIAAIPSAALWAFMYTAPGILLGALSREVPKGETTQFFLYGLAIIAIVWLIFWLIQHFFIQLARGINKITDRCWSYLSRNDGGRSFIRLITNQQNPSDHHQLTMFIAAFISAVLFLILFFSVRTHGVLTDWNYAIFHLIQTIRTPSANDFFVFMTIIATPSTISFCTLLVVAGLVIKKQYRTAIHLFLGLFLACGAVFVFKHLSHSIRPQGFEVVSHESSFPSGHTTLAFVVFLLLAFFSTQILSKKTQWIPYTIAGILITLIACSRLYLGAHWFADIIGAMLLALPIVFVCIISYRTMPNAQSRFHLPWPTLALILFIGFALPWSINMPRLFHRELFASTPIWETQNLSLQTWWESPLDYTPLFRNNRLGDPFQPFNVQWQGAVEQIAQQLESTGWTEVPKHSKLEFTIKRFASHEAQYHIPLLPWLYHDKSPVLFLIKAIPEHNRIIELRLWKTNIQFQPGGKPLLIGATDILIPPKVLFSLKEKTTISLANNAGLTQLYSDATNYVRKYVEVPSKEHPKTIRMLGWNGKILLLKEK